MPVVVPEHLRPFVFHGVELSYAEESAQATGECPFCGKEKLFVRVENGLWDCKVCSSRGNPVEFLRMLWEASQAGTTPPQRAVLARQRGLLSGETIREWGLCRSLLTGEWLVPGFDVDGKLQQLYRYTEVKGRLTLMATPTLNQHLHGVNLYRREKGTVYLCEGVWDGMALWEMLQRCKRDGDGLLLTGDPAESMGADINVLATPSASVHLPSWTQLCAGKRVSLLYDNDHPAQDGQCAGRDGMMRFTKFLMSAEENPREVRYLRWGEDGYTINLPSGYDVRDWLVGEDTRPITRLRLQRVQSLLEKLEPVPEEWLKGIARTAVPCDSYRELTNAWRRAMKWTTGLDCALSVMLCSIISTKSHGDQLWVRAVGPASSGKSSLCEALSVNKKYVMAKSTIKGFHSGYKSDKTGEEDHSLVNALRDKTLVIKDGDTLLQSPNLGQILSEARDIYDRSSRTSYRNGIDRNYERLNITLIICGTSSLRKLDQSELGERFLDCVIMDRIDPDLEEDILWQVAQKAHRDVRHESNGQPDSHDSPEMTRVKELTAGYINHLRRNARGLLEGVEMGETALRQCMKLGKFVAIMRARPSKSQEEVAERELGARLTGQMIRLASCMAAVLNRKSVDNVVMQRVRKVALDTARGQSLDICRRLFKQGERGVDAGALSTYTHQREEQTRLMLRFLKRIEAVEHVPVAPKVGLNVRPRWRLTEELTNLYAVVVGPEE